MMTFALIAALLCQAPGAATEENPQKQVASGAIEAARAAINQSQTTEKRDEANVRLKQAEGLYATQNYSEAAKAADAAWRIVSDAKSGPTSFTVEVAENGKTKVTSNKGQPVRVDAEGVTQPLYAGQLVTVEKGGKPKDIITPGALAVPQPLSPREDQKFTMKASRKLSAPVAVTWKAVEGASAYELEVQAAEPAQAKPLRLKTVTTKTKLPRLPPGKYAWTVRAVGRDGRVGAQSSVRAFEVTRDDVKIEVQNTKWK